MPVDRRHANVNWELPTTPEGKIGTWDAVKVAVLMDIRDELQAIRRVLECSNTTRIPKTLMEIRAAVRLIPSRKRATNGK